MKSATSDWAARSRSIDFGVKTMSGRRGRSYAWRRSRWKYDAGVVGAAAIMLSSAHSCKKRSMRADEWSGP